MSSTTALNRAQMLERLRSGESFDVVVIGGGFNADEGPEAQQYGAGSGRYVGSTGHVPVGDVGIDVKPEPTEDGRPDDGDRHRNKTERREFADEGTAQKV